MQASASHRNSCHLPRQLQPADHGLPSSSSGVLVLLVLAPPVVSSSSWYWPFRTQETLRGSGLCPRATQSTWKGGPEAGMNRLSSGGWKLGLPSELQGMKGRRMSPHPTSLLQTPSPHASPSFWVLWRHFFPSSTAFPYHSRNLPSPSASLLARI